MHKDTEIILERIEPLFKRLRNTQYQIHVANDIYDKEYNFFFYIAPRNHRPKSVPLHTIKGDNYNLEYLEFIVNEIKEKYNFTLNYTGFTGMKFPASDTYIQKKKHIDE